MSAQASSSNHAEETAACCCVDVGTVIDNSDCTVHYSATFPDRETAEAMLSKLTAQARKIESEPCQITHQFISIDNAIQLTVSFAFACQAESLIFQLALR